MQLNLSRLFPDLILARPKTRVGESATPRSSVANSRFILEPFAKQSQIAAIPCSYDQEDGHIDSYPAHWGIVQEKFEFRLMSIMGYKSVFKDAHQMTFLESTLRNEQGVSARDVEVWRFPARSVPDHLPGFLA